MDYEMIDSEKTTQEVVKGRIVDTAVVAYQHELELRRLQAHVTAGDETVKQLLPQAAETAQRHRRRALRAAESEVIVPSIDKAVKDALLERMRAICAQAEGAHAQHSRMKAERERILALTGDLAPTDEERAEIEANVAINDIYIKDSEIVHTMVCEDITLLVESMPQDEQARDSRDMEIADALARAEANRPGAKD